MQLQAEVREIVRREGVIARKDHPGLVDAMGWLVRRGELAAVLPGVFSAKEASATFETRVGALARWDPEGILTGATAGRLTFWPTLSSPTVECAVRWDRVPRPGFTFRRRAIPPELVVERGPLRLTSPALTALDLCETRDGDGIDHALLRRATTLELMREALALTGGRDGNVHRRAMLLDSRDEPWSAAERLAHRLLREAHLTGWRSNLPVVAGGEHYFVDIAFPALRLAVEIDGRLHEEDKDIFENDRWRQNALVLDGWMVLRFTWRMLQEHPERVVADIRRAIALIRSAR